MQYIIPAIICLAIILVSVKLFKSPFRIALKLLVNTLLGIAVLVIINLVSGLTGITLGINLANALIIGVFGLPGVGLLLILRLILMI